MKYIFCDLETSGLDPSKHAVLQIAGLIDIDGEIVDEFNLHIQPFEGQTLSKESLEVNNFTFDGLRTFKKPMDAYNSLMNKFNKHVDRFNKNDKFFLVGYNSNFDDTFLRQFFKNCGDDFYGSFIWWPTIDVAAFAAEFLKEERHKFPNFKLTTVAKAFGIEVDEKEAHDALYDSHLARKIYRKMILGID